MSKQIRNNSRGSEWRIWDLHVHTPASYGGSYETFVENASRCVAAVIGINDYATLEGYEAIQKLGGIPGVIVQGRHDTCTPPVAAWKLKKAWPEVDLNIIPDAGHLFNEPGILDGLVRATDKFASM